MTSHWIRWALPALLLVLLASCAGTRTTTDLPVAADIGRSEVYIPNAVAGDAVARGVQAPGAQPAAPLSQTQIQNIARRRLTEAARLWDLAIRYEDKNPAAAAELFESVVDDYPEYERAAEAKFRQGRSLFRACDYIDAALALQTYMTIAPVNPHLAEVEEMLYESGCRSLSSRGGLFSIFKSDDDALGTLEYLARTFPAGEYADDALLRLADYYRLDEEYESAARTYKELLLRYPDSEWSFKAYLRLGDTYMARDQGNDYTAGFLQIDPREMIPAEQAKMTAPVASALMLALRQYETYLERMEADPARMREYCQDVAYARRKRQECRERLASKDLARGNWYMGQACVDGALGYYREAARWTGTRAGATAQQQLQAIEQRRRSTTAQARTSAPCPPTRRVTTPQGTTPRTVPTPTRTVYRGPAPSTSSPTPGSSVPMPPRPSMPAPLPTYRPPAPPATYTPAAPSAAPRTSPPVPVTTRSVPSPGALPPPRMQVPPPPPPPSTVPGMR